MWLGSEDETTYNSVVKDMRLPEKQLFGLPVTFDLPEVDGLKTGDKLLLKWKGEEVAVLEAASIWQPNKAPWPCLVAVSQPFLACFRSLRHPSGMENRAEHGRYVAYSRWWRRRSATAPLAWSIPPWPRWFRTSAAAPESTLEALESPTEARKTMFTPYRMPLYSLYSPPNIICIYIVESEVGRLMVSRQVLRGW